MNSFSVIVSFLGRNFKSYHLRSLWLKMRNILATLFFCQALVGINSFRFADPAKQEELKNELEKGQFV